MIKVRNLNKKIWKTEILSDVNLDIPNGLFGILGPNGAGKSTLLNIIATVENMTSGRITKNELTWSKRKTVRNHIGYLPQQISLYKQLTCRELLEYFSHLKNIKINNQEIDRILQEVNLIEVKNTKIGRLSGGMTRRVGIAQALLGDPQILIVDEPTAGLDILERNRFRNLLKKLGKNKTIIISSHIVEDLDSICDFFAILIKGNIILQGAKKEIINNVSPKVKRVLINEKELNHYIKKYNVSSFKQSEQYNNMYDLRILTKENINNSKVVTPNLEECYMELVNLNGGVN